MNCSPRDAHVSTSDGVTTSESPKRLTAALGLTPAALPVPCADTLAGPHLVHESHDNSHRQALVSELLDILAGTVSPLHWHLAACAICEDLDAGATTRESVAALAGECAARWKVFRSLVARAEGTSTLPGPQALDAHFVEFVAGLGPMGMDRAEMTRRKCLGRYQRTARSAWALWLAEDDGPTGLHTSAGLRLAEVLWSDIVRPRLSEQNRAQPALARTIVESSVLRPMVSRLGVSETDGTMLVDSDGLMGGRFVGGVLDSRTVESVIRGLRGFRTVTGNRLLREVVLRAHEQFMAGDVDARVVAFRGGLAGLAERLGLNSKKHCSTLLDLLRAGQHVAFADPNVEIGGLWTFALRRGNSSRGAGEVRVVVGDALCPGLVVDVSGQRPSKREARRLVPELRWEPPVGNMSPNLHGRIWVLHRLLLVHMVDRAEELVGDEGLVIPPQSWGELAQRAGMSPTHMRRLHSIWLNGDDRNPPLLERLDGRWNLADAHWDARTFIRHGGLARLRGRRAGHRSQDAKRRRLGRSA